MNKQRKIIIYIATSLDGYIAGENGEIDWLFSDQDYGYSEFIQSIDTIIMGRKTYETALSFGEFPYKGKKCYVFTRNKDLKPHENLEFINQDVLEFCETLQSQEGLNIWVDGGSELIAEFMKYHLVDEYIISIHPILLGKGIPLFKGGFPEVSLELKGQKNYVSGLVQLHYIKRIKEQQK